MKNKTDIFVKNLYKSMVIENKLKSTKKYDNNKHLKGDQDDLPDNLQKGIIKKLDPDDPDLEEGKKRKKKRNPDYFKGTKKSNKQMDYEIKKCSGPNPPKSCYDEWTADKTYKKSKKYKMAETREIIKQMLIEAIIEEKKKRKSKKKKSKKKKSSSKKLSAATRKTLREKAKKANMPTSALTRVYRKGLAAWLTGHRQGVAQHQWAMGRVNSFIRGGKTRSVDKAEWKSVQKFRSKKK